MPYIDKDKRQKYSTYIAGLVATLPESNDKAAGELNYVISKIMKEYVRTWGPKYARYNMLLGMLDCAAKEFYAREVRPYEDKAIKKNGDI